MSIRAFILNVLLGIGINHAWAEEFKPMPKSIGEVAYATGDVWVARVGASGHVERARLKSLSQAYEGDEIITSPKGIVYLRTHDGGYFILKGNSQGRIVRYFTHASDPSLSEYRLEVSKGRGRIVSGSGPQANRDRFRLNTPVAAIGIRGTDFTVITDQDTTKAAIHFGAIRLARISGDCQAEALGPCSVTSALDLSPMGVLAAEVSRQNIQPKPIPADSILNGSMTGDRNQSSTNTKAKEPGQEKSGDGEITPLPITASRPKSELDVDIPQPAEAATPASLAWGRWAHIAALPPTLDTKEVAAKGMQLAFIDSTNAIFRDPAVRLNMPNEGSASFTLNDHQGIFIDVNSGKATASEAHDAFLKINFSEQTFETGLSLRTPHGESTRINGQGVIDAKGTFSNSSLAQTRFRGILGGVNGEQAAYLYNHQISESLQANGTAFWRINR